MNGQRAIFYGAMLGIAFGGFTWVVVAGNLIHQPAVSLSGVVLGSLVWVVGGWLLVRHPVRRALIMGCVILFVAIVDRALLAVVLPRLPAEGGSIYIGTSRSAYVLLEPILLIAGLAGAGLVLWDLLLRRR